MNRIEYPYEQDALQAYSSFLLQHKLDEISAHQVSIAFHYDIPLLEKLKHLDQKQLIAITKHGFAEFLTYFSEGRAQDQIADSLEKWQEDKLEIVGKFDINARDITLINDVRETTMTHFIDDFTNDLNYKEKIRQQLHQFIVASNTAAFEAYENILKQRIAKQENQLLEAQSLAKVGSFEWDLTSDQSHHTPELRKIFNLTTSGYQNWMENVHPEDKERVEHNVKQSFVTGSYDSEYRYIVAGTEKTLWSKGEVLFDKDGKATLMRGTVQDITEWKKITEQLQTTLHEKSQLTLLNLYKDEFLNIASHELKTPLTSIKAFLQLALTIEKDPQPLTFMNKALTHVSKLEKLISDLLDTSKLNAGQLVYNKERFDFSVLVREVAAQFETNHPDRKIHLALTSPAFVFGDKLRLEQVLNNITDNALKYSQDIVDIAVTKQNGSICVQIKDKGIGIALEDQKHLFNRFFRSPNVSFSHNGLGLGLYISAKIVENHGGNFQLESEVNKGSCFSFCLPECVHEEVPRSEQAAAVMQ